MALGNVTTREWLMAGLTVFLIAGCELGTSGPHPSPPSAGRQPAPTPDIVATPSPAEPSPTPSPTPTAKPPEGPVTVRADGRSNAESFRLEGGDYSLAYNLIGECVYFAQLRAPDGTSRPIEFSPRNGPSRGSTQIRNLAPGGYVADVITGPAPACGWVLTFTKI